MDIHKNARLTPRGRERMVNRVLGGQTPKAAGQAVGVCPRTVRNGSSASKPKAWPACRIAARGPTSASTDTPTDGRSHRGPAPTAPDRQGDRRRNRRLGCHREPGPQASGPQQTERPGACRAGPPLRAGTAGRTDPHRYQKARQVRPDRPSHHRRSNRSEQRPRRRLGVRPCLHRRCLTHRLQPYHDDRTQRHVPSPSSRPPSPTMPASASWSSAS